MLVLPFLILSIFLIPIVRLEVIIIVYQRLSTNKIAELLIYFYNFLNLHLVTNIIYYI